MFMSLSLLSCACLTLTSLAPNTTNISVLSLEPASAPVDPNFVGLSIEVSATAEMLVKPTAVLLSHLAATTPAPHAGPVLRIGGNSADESCFESNVTGCNHIITSDELKHYKAFAATAPNVSFVVDVNFGRSPDPTLAAAHVRALGELDLWPLVSAVEIGNEIDIYAKPTAEEQREKGHRSQSYDYGAYERDYAVFLSALQAAGLPHRRLQGGTYCSFSSEPPRGSFHSAANFTRLLDAFGGEFATFSYHRYPTSTCGGASTSIGALLSDQSIGGQLELLAPYVAATTTARGPNRSVPFWIGEGNSASCGGQTNVSDTFAAALWAADFLATLSKGGVSGMNLHGGPRGPYLGVRRSGPSVRWVWREMLREATAGGGPRRAAGGRGRAQGCPPKGAWVEGQTPWMPRRRHGLPSRTAAPPPPNPPRKNATDNVSPPGLVQVSPHRLRRTRR